MSEPVPKTNRGYTYADYLTWSDDQRWEIIGGIAYLMSPSPNRRHQRIVGELHRQMANHFKGKPCEVIVAPMDVVLSEEDVVQPDILVVCEERPRNRRNVAVPPTLVIEVVSPHSAQRDRLLKLALYARRGVKEYWIVTPWPSLVEVLRLAHGKYVVELVCGQADRLVSPTFPELEITLADVFDFPLEPGEEPPVVKEPPGRAYTLPAP